MIYLGIIACVGVITGGCCASNQPGVPLLRQLAGRRVVALGLRPPLHQDDLLNKVLDEAEQYQLGVAFKNGRTDRNYTQQLEILCQIRSKLGDTGLRSISYLFSPLGVNSNWILSTVSPAYQKLSATIILDVLYNFILYDQKTPGF